MALMDDEELERAKRAGIRAYDLIEEKMPDQHPQRRLIIRRCILVLNEIGDEDAIAEFRGRL